MDFAPLLAGISRLEDLPTLVRAFGHPAMWEELAPAPLQSPVTAAAVVGRAGSFEWLGVVCPPGMATASGLSRSLARRGRTVAVLALDPVERTLELALTLDRTVVMGLALDRPGPGDLERLRRLSRASERDGVAFALRAMEAIGGEDAGRRFFRAFAAGLETMAESLTGPVPPGDRHALALIQLTRVLVLYFVQAKGWLDGRPDFLRSALDDALATRRRVHRDLFRPLFFGTLNRPLDQRGRARAFGRVPFLNGGLFEPHPLERAWRGEVPNAAWRDAFDRIFERFHFSAQETVGTGRIAPDMLGRVFEGVMAPADRRASGAFYTPAALVTRLVDASLHTWLAAQLDCPADEVHARLRQRPLVADQLLDHITILDPAVGSGAFLLGALERLAALQAHRGGPAAIRRRILERNLFGVDQNPMAVRLAELRLWLAVIAEEEVTDIAEVAPLPNLDGVVRQGDSLVDPAWFLAGLGTGPSAATAALAESRRAFVRASGPDKRNRLRQLRLQEVRAFAESLDTAERRLEGRLSELLQGARAADLFGARRGLDRAGRGELRQTRARLSEVRRLRRRLRTEGGVPWFQYQCQFGDVIAAGGFDMVLGNPPWVRAEELPPRLRAQLGRRYRWWAGVGPGFRHQPDLSVAFVERSLELVRPGGVVGLLLPAKIASAGYATRLRQAVAAGCTIHRAADLRGDPTAAFEATIYPAALVLERSTPPPDHEVRLELEGERGGIPQHRLAGGGPWTLCPRPLLDALAELRGQHPTVGARFTPQLGVKTGANVVFLDPPPDLEPAVVRTALRGRDILPFTVRPRLRLFFPYQDSGEPVPRLPRQAAAFVRTHDPVLRARTDYRGGPPWVLFRVRPALAPHRVIWADIARQLCAVPLSGPGTRDIIPLNSCYVLPVPEQQAALALTAWLNSTWLRAAARSAADPASSGFARFNARVVAGLPLPDAVTGDQRLARIARCGARGESIQEELDVVCAEHLALAPGTRAILAAAPGTGTDHRRGSPAGRR